MSINKRPDILDIFVVNISTSLKNVTNNYLDFRNMLRPFLSPSISRYSTSPTAPTSLTDGITDWNKFREIIEQKINLKTRLKCPNKLKNAVQHFTEIIQTAAWSSTIKEPWKAQNSFPILTHVRELIAKKRRASSL